MNPLRITMQTVIRLLALFTLCSGPLLADTFPSDGQVNFESPHVHPIDLTPDRSTLLAVNTAAHRLEVYDINGAQLDYRGHVAVGIDPVSVRARNNNEAWVVNHISDSVSVVDLNNMVVTATLNTDNEPADVVFAGTPQRAFVSCSEANRINVFNPANPNTSPSLMSISKGAIDPLRSRPRILKKASFRS